MRARFCRAGLHKAPNQGRSVQLLLLRAGLRWAAPTVQGCSCSMLVCARLLSLKAGLRKATRDEGWSAQGRS